MTVDPAVPGPSCGARPAASPGRGGPLRAWTRLALAGVVLLAGCGDASLPDRLLLGLRGRLAQVPACQPVQPGHPGTVPALVAALLSPLPPTRQAAARELGRLGPRAPETFPALVAALREEEENADVRYSLVMALASHGPRAAAALGEALAGPDHGVRYAAALALAQMGQGAAADGPALVRALRDPEPTVRYAVLIALAEMGRAGLPGLDAALDSSDLNARLLAVRSIGRLGRPAAEMAPRLRALALRDPRVASEVGRALRRLDGP